MKNLLQAVGFWLLFAALLPVALLRLLGPAPGELRRQDAFPGPWRRRWLRFWQWLDLNTTL